MMRWAVRGIYILSLQSCILFCMNTESFLISALPPIHCLAFINDSTLLVGTSSECRTIENIGTRECLIKVFDDRPPCNFVLNHDRTRLAIKRKKNFSIYDLNTQKKLSEIEAPCDHYSLAISADNIPFVCCQNILINTQSSERFDLPEKTKGFNITCHPHEKIISYIDTSDTIINIDHTGKLISIYHPSASTHTNVFYPHKDHIASICYSPDSTTLICTTQANYVLVYDTREKRSINYLIQQHADFFNSSILACVDHHGSIVFLDYKKKDVNQNITHTIAMGSSPIYSTPSKKRFDFSPNKLLFALCIDGICYIKHTPIAVLKNFFMNRYSLLKQSAQQYNIPIEIIRLIIYRALLPHLHHPLS